MKAVRVAIGLAVIGVILCLWLLVRVDWYTFLAFMLLAQPLLLVAALIFAAAVLRELRKKGVL
jgi:multisubunit Na+/H+ antiporter MnhG subunit